MKIGTKSVLFGAHQFLIHPLMLARAWRRLYGFPYDPRLWVAFFVHDLGYVGKKNMDGTGPDDGESHPELGGAIMRHLFGERWGNFTLWHSRFYSDKVGAKFSKLCVADKLATVITPRWLYLRLVTWTGEIEEYMRPPSDRYEGTYTTMIRGINSPCEWHGKLIDYMSGWVDGHKDEGLDVIDCAINGALSNHRQKNSLENSGELP